MVRPGRLQAATFGTFRRHATDGGGRRVVRHCTAGENALEVANKDKPSDYCDEECKAGGEDRLRVEPLEAEHRHKAVVVHACQSVMARNDKR